MMMYIYRCIYIDVYNSGYSFVAVSFTYQFIDVAVSLMVVH